MDARYCGFDVSHLDLERLHATLNQTWRRGRPGKPRILQIAKWVSGEEDRCGRSMRSPDNVCPVIGDFIEFWNCDLDDNDCYKLLHPFIPWLIGSCCVNKETHMRRGAMAADWLIRVHSPTWLRLAGMNEAADRLKGLTEITDIEQCVVLADSSSSILQDAKAETAEFLDFATPASQNWCYASECRRNVTPSSGIAQLRNQHCFRNGTCSSLVR